MANRPKVTAEKKEAFLLRLAETGSVTAAAASTTVSRREWYRTRDEDEDFAAAWEGAIETYAEALEAEADRRAKDGVEKPVFYQGKQVATVREYSDTLLMFRLNGLRPDRYRQRHEVTGKDGGPIQLEAVEQFQEAAARARAHAAKLSGGGGKGDA